MSDLHWVTFVNHWKNVNPNIKKLARKFTTAQMKTITSIASEAWCGDISEFLRPATVEDAISFAITMVYEMSHPEFSKFRETIH